MTTKRRSGRRRSVEAAVEDTVARFSRWVREQRLPAGARLPGERGFAEILGEGPYVIRKVLARLEAEGKIAAISPKIRVLGAASCLYANPASRNLGMISFVGYNAPERMEEMPISRAILGSILAAAEHGNDVSLFAPGHSAESMLEKLGHQSFAGLILHADVSAAGYLPALTRRLVSEGIPLCVSGDVLPADISDSPPCDCVSGDHAGGARQLTEWLLSRGCRRILRCRGRGLPDFRWVRERARGHEDACRDAGIDPPPALEVPLSGVDNGTEEAFLYEARSIAGFLIEPLRAGVDALMAPSDHGVFFLAAACRLLGYEPQKDVAIVGYDDFSAHCREAAWEPSRPPVTVDKKDRQTGREMVSLLLDRLRGELPPEAQHRVVPHMLKEV